MASRRERAGGWLHHEGRLISFSECKERQEAMLVMPAYTWVRGRLGTFFLEPDARKPWHARLVLSAVGVSAEMRYRKGGIDLKSSQDTFLLQTVLRSRHVSHEQLWEFMQHKAREHRRRVFNWRLKRLVDHELVVRQSDGETVVGVLDIATRAPNIWSTSEIRQRCW